MTSRRGYSSKPGHIFLAISDSETHFDQNLELYEADVWDWCSSNANNTVTEPKSKNKKKKVHQPPKRDQKKRDSDDDEDCDGDDGDGGGVMMPPHEYLARTRGASHSVQEGKGRTLKGRDLHNVRSDVWKKTGFEG